MKPMIATALGFLYFLILVQTAMRDQIGTNLV